MDKNDLNHSYTHFMNPPNQYGPIPFYWWHGEPLTIERITWQLDRLQEQGVTGVNINYQHDTHLKTYVGEPAIFTEPWWELWQQVVEECRKRDMTIGFDDYTLAWPDKGKFALDIIGENPQMVGGRMEYLSAWGCEEAEVRLEVPPGTLDITAKAYPGLSVDGTELGEPIDLHAYVNNVELKWVTPAGKWLVVLVLVRPGGLDPMHPEIGAQMIKHYYEPFAQRNPEALGTTLNYFFQDELNFVRGGMPYWSERLPEVFLDKKGYDLIDVLPALWFDIGSATPKIRMDYYDVVVSLMEASYFIPIYEWHESHGMTMGCDQESRGSLVQGVHAYGDYFRTMRWFGAPGADDPGPSDRRNLIKGKVHSSIAQLYGRPRVWLEGYHSSGWGVTPAQLIAYTNENFTYGFNLLNLHGLYYTTYGGWWEWAPPDFHFRQPYWEHMGAFNAYVKRLSYLMSQGVHRCDVALLYPTSTVQAGVSGEAAEQATNGLAQSLYDGGIDFDFIDDASLEAAVIENGRLKIAGGEYQCLILPMTGAIRYSTLQKALDFYRNGGVVIAYGCLPFASDRMGRHDAQLNEAVEEMFGKAASGNGLYVEAGFERVFHFIKERVQRSVIPGTTDVIVQHRLIEGDDYYFINNIRNEPVQADLDIRGQSHLERWDAWSGGKQAIVDQRLTSNGIAFTLSLAPRELQIVVCSAACSDSEGLASSTGRIEIQRMLPGDWEVRLHSTMDNQWGDYRLPAAPDMLGAEARQFRYMDGEKVAEEWHLPHYDDEHWPTYTASFGPQLWQIGPFPAEAELDAYEAEWLNRVQIDEHASVKIGAETYHYSPYNYSWKWGVERDPHLLYWLTGPHGLKQAVPNEFIDLGNEGLYPKPNIFYDAESGESLDLQASMITPPASVWYLWTTVFADQAIEKICYLKALTYTSVYPITEQPLPCKVWLNGSVVAEQSGETVVQLNQGVNRLLFKFVQSNDHVSEHLVDGEGIQGFPGKLRLKAYAVLADFEEEGAKPLPQENPLQMRWLQLKGRQQYDLWSQHQSKAGCFRFTAPPGLNHMKLQTMGPIDVWVDGLQAIAQCSRVDDGGLHHYEVKVQKPPERTSMVAIRIQQHPGFYAGAAIPEPIQLTCGAGQAPLVEWNQLGLAAYSGKVSYRKHINLAAEQLNGELWLDLQQVWVTAEVKINGLHAGTLIAPPWRLEITKLVQEGNNELEIIVANTLANHYSVGIPSLYVYPGQTKAGLLGPVKLSWYPSGGLE